MKTLLIFLLVALSVKAAKFQAMYCDDPQAGQTGPVYLYLQEASANVPVVFVEMKPDGSDEWLRSFSCEIPPGTYTFYIFKGGAYAVASVASPRAGESGSSFTVEDEELLTGYIDTGGAIFQIVRNTPNLFQAFSAGFLLMGTVRIFRAALRWFKRAGTERHE